MVRTSSPGVYSRTSSNSIPLPLKTEWYSPASDSFTSRLVRISIRRILLRISWEVGSICGISPEWRPSRHFDGVQDPLDDRFRGHLLCFRLVGQKNAVTQDVEGDRFYILGSRVPSPLDESMGLGGEGQVDRRSRRGAERDEGGDVELVVLGRSGGQDDVDDVVLHPVIHIDLVDD